MEARIGKNKDLEGNYIIMWFFKGQWAIERLIV